MTNSLITQAGADTLTSASGAAPRVTQSGVDALTTATGAKPSVTQSGVDSLISASGAKPRITQSGFDVLASFLLAPSVTLFSLCSRQIEIDAVATGGLQFDFYRSDNPYTGFVLVGSNGGGVLVDTVPLAFTDYWYAVAVTYVSGLGPLSTPLSAQAKDVLEAMPGFTAIVPGDGQVTLVWAAFPSATGYIITRDGVTIATGLTSLSYVDTGVTDGTQYAYQVSAINECGDGLLSDAATVTPQCCQTEFSGDTVACGGYSSDVPLSNSWGRQNCP